MRRNTNNHDLTDEKQDQLDYAFALTASNPEHKSTKELQKDAMALLDAGARPNAKIWIDKQKRYTTALHQAVNHGTPGFVEWLLLNGADANVRNGGALLPMDQDMMERPDIEVENIDHFMSTHDAGGLTPLHMAALHDDYEMMLILIHHGANMNAAAAGGNTPLHLIANQPETVFAPDILLAAGADPSLRNAKGQTPFDIANAIAADLEDRTGDLRVNPDFAEGLKAIEEGLMNVPTPESIRDKFAPDVTLKLDLQKRKALMENRTPSTMVETRVYERLFEDLKPAERIRSH